MVAALFGAAMGLLRLNLGVVSTFDEVLQNFHQGPSQWWERCISEKGTRNIPGCAPPPQPPTRAHAYNAPSHGL